MRALPSRLALCFILMPAIFACRVRDDSRVKNIEDQASQQLEPVGSLMVQLGEAGRESAAMPVLTPSMVWKKIVANGGENETTQMLEDLMVKILAGHDRSLVTSIVTSGLGSVASAIPLLAAAVGDATPDEIRLLARRLGPIISANPSLLDTLATIDLATVSAFQAAAIRRSAGSGIVDGVKPFMISTASLHSVDLTNTNCTIPADQFATIREFAAGTLVMGRPNIRAGVSPCFQEISTNLAFAFNAFANNELAGEHNAVVIKTGDGHEVTATSSLELLDAVRAAGYTLEILTSRVFVEFKALIWVDRSTQVMNSVRFSTWIKAKADTTPVRAPAEHGEIVVVLHKGGERVAQVRWYAGLPDEAFPNQSAYWRPFHELAAPWSGIVHETVEVYKGDMPMQGAAEWFTATAHLMKGYQAINVAVRPPYNAYGLLVCTDSLTAALAKLAEIRGQPHRLSEAFPILRAQVKVDTSEHALTLDAFLEKHASIAPSTLSSVYPVDTIVARSPAAWKERLRRAFPWPNGSRYEYFPEFASTLQSVIHN